MASLDNLHHLAVAAHHGRSLPHSRSVQEGSTANDAHPPAAAAFSHSPASSSRARCTHSLSPGPHQVILNPTHEPLPPTLISSRLHRQALSPPRLIESHSRSVFSIAPSLLRACTPSPLTVMTAIEEPTPGNAGKDVSNDQSCRLAARRILPRAPYSPRVQAISAPRLLKPRVPAVSQCFSSPTSTPICHRNPPVHALQLPHASAFVSATTPLRLGRNNSLPSPLPRQGSDAPLSLPRR